MDVITVMDLQVLLSAIYYYGVSDVDLFYRHQETILRLRGIVIGRHFQANMKVQTAMCKDNNNSKSRAATCVKFDIRIK